MRSLARPALDEAGAYYHGYIARVGTEPLERILARHLDEVPALVAGISDRDGDTSYAPGKWTVKEVLAHVNDVERVFVGRALWFARDLGGELPGFDQDAAVRMSNAGMRSCASHAEEFRALRASTIALFAGLPSDAWERRGIASGSEITVRALAYITAGHVEHHLDVLRDRYRNVPGISAAP